MERLTYKNYIEEYEVNFEKSSDKNWSIAESDTHIKVTGEPIEKLGELEDILESWHIENLEELKTRLNDCQVYHLENNSNETLIHNLKNELADLEHRLEVADKALELACSHIPCKTCPNSNGAGICYIAQDIGYYQPKENCNIDNSYYFKLKAEKEMKGE